MHTGIPGYPPGIPEITPEFRGTPPGITVHTHPPPEYRGKNRGVG